jgi:hypothetical protein
VEVEHCGPAAWIHYREAGVHLRFWREFLVDGAALSVPSPEEWDSVCIREHAGNALGRRGEIVQRVVDELRRHTPGMTADDRRDWIHLKF